MPDNNHLTHDFEMSWLSPLDVEQVHYLFFYMFTANRFFAPATNSAQPGGANPNTVHNWDDLAFYMSTKCPDSTRYPADIYRKAWDNFQRLHTKGPDTQWRLKYSMMTQVFPDPWLSFMNYGYYDFESGNTGLVLEDNDEEWRFAIQLYQRLLGSLPIEGKDILEVGCGRGGGASFITRYMKPASYTGTDGTMSNIMFCNDVHDIPSLDFQWSKAESLPFQDGNFDIVINLESCNYYNPFSDFVNEVGRILRTGGYMAFSTWDAPVRMRFYRTECENRGFQLIEEEDITFNVAMALEAFDSGRHVFANHQAIRRNHLYLESWRRTYNVQGILSGRSRYIRYILRKLS